MSSFARTRAESEFSALMKSPSISKPEPIAAAANKSAHVDGPNTLHLSLGPKRNNAGPHVPGSDMTRAQP